MQYRLVGPEHGVHGVFETELGDQFSVVVVNSRPAALGVRLRHQVNGPVVDLVAVDALGSRLADLTLRGDDAELVAGDLPGPVAPLVVAGHRELPEVEPDQLIE